MSALEKISRESFLLSKLGVSRDDYAAMADGWRRAIKLEPLTRKQAEAMPLGELAGRARDLLAHWKLTLITEHDFIVAFRVELNVLRKRCRQQGRQIVKEGRPSWGEIKKAFTMSGRQVDRLLQDPAARPARKALPPVSVVVRRGDPGQLAAELRGWPTGVDGKPDAALLREFARNLDEAWALALLEALQDRLYEVRYERHRREALEGGAEPQDAAEHAHLMAQQEEVDDEEEERDRRRDRGKVAEGPVPGPAADGLPGGVGSLARQLNALFAARKGRRERMEELAAGLDTCVLWELFCACDWQKDSRQHPWPSDAAERALAGGGFWSARALYDEADIHGWRSKCCGPWSHVVNLKTFKEVLLGLRKSGRLKSRMLGGVYWYCRPGDEVPLMAAGAAGGEGFHAAEGELRARGRMAHTDCPTNRGGAR